MCLQSRGDALNDLRSLWLLVLQPIFDTLESWLKVPILRRQQGAAPQVGAPTSAVYPACTAFTSLLPATLPGVLPGPQLAHAWLLSPRRQGFPRCTALPCTCA